MIKNYFTIFVVSFIIFSLTIIGAQALPERTLGSSDADVEILMYSDFTCPFSKRFYEETLDLIKTNFINQDEVVFVFKDFPVVGGQRAAEAGWCAHEQGAFWEYANELFSRELSDISDSELISIAEGIGLNRNDFGRCLANDKYVHLVAAERQEAIDNGVRGTPGFLINGDLVSGAQPYNFFEKILNDILGIENIDTIDDERTDCMDGCSFQGRCLSFGTRMLNENNVPVYCSILGEFTNQREEQESCQNNYECLSNQCSNGACIDLSRQLEETSGLMQRLIEFFGRIFR